jgi:hypothetical protein
MTDTQLMTLALAVIIPLSMLIYSNSRITEAKETLRAETQKSHAEIMATLERIVSQVRTMETNFEARLKIHELEHHR